MVLGDSHKLHTICLHFQLFCAFYKQIFSKDAQKVLNFGNFWHFFTNKMQNTFENACKLYVIYKKTHNTIPKTYIFDPIY